MKILVTGSTGFVGKLLVPFLEEKGHEVYKLIRHGDPANTHEISLDRLKEADFEDIEAVINLAGENIAKGRWTEEKKKEIKDSRVELTRQLCNILAKLKYPPSVLINASAVGYYGDQGEEILNEKSPKGTGFLSDVCEEWEEATKPAQDRGIRVVKARFGAILHPSGGLLKQILLPFKLGLGGKVGSGSQYMSWIAMDDVLRVIEAALQNNAINGPINVVAPRPITNAEFTEILGEVLNRPTFMTLPAFVARLVVGEMADELMLASTRAVPEVLEKNNFQFFFLDIKNALNHMLN